MSFSHSKAKALRDASLIHRELASPGTSSSPVVLEGPRGEGVVGGSVRWGCDGFPDA
jgi:hypothetical protein